MGDAVAEWRDLSDDELARKLLRTEALSEISVRVLVDMREDDVAVEAIERALAGDDPWGFGG